MIFTIQYKKAEYKKDYLRYFVHKKRLPISIALSIISLLTLLYLWVWIFGGLIVFQQNYLFITVVCFISVLGMFSFVTPYIREVIRSAELLPLSPQKISFLENEVKIELDGEKYILSYSDFKEMKSMSGTLFLVLKDEFEWPIRINKKEMDEKATSEIAKIMDRKGIKLK